MKTSEAEMPMATAGPATIANTGRRQLLMLAYYFPPLSESGALRPFRFAKYLTQSGFATSVITASEPGATPPWKDVLLATEDDSAWPSDGMDGWAAKILHRVLPFNDRLRWFPGAVRAGEAALRGGGVHAVISTSPPVATHVAALLMKQRYGVPWVADFRDPVAGNPFRSALRAQWFDRYLERKIVATADAVIANTANAAEALRARYPTHSHKIHLIWNGYDPDVVLDPLPSPRRAHRVILHAGSLYGGRHPGALLQALDALFTRGDLKREDLHLRLIGSLDQGAEWAEKCGFERLVAEGWVERVDQIPHREAQKEMREADVLLLLDLNERGASLQLPAKLFEYVRTGKPILAFTTRNSAAEHILSQCGVPHCCLYQDDDPQQVARRVLEFLQYPVEPAAPNAWFRENFDGAAQARSLAEILSAL